MPKKNTYKTKSVPGVKKGFRRGTYYLTPELMKLLKHRAIEDGKDYSEVVRDALTAYLITESAR
jgi:Ribbon-helix-helix protein, copG family